MYNNLVDNLEAIYAKNKQEHIKDESVTLIAKDSYFNAKYFINFMNNQQKSIIQEKDSSLSLVGKVDNVNICMNFTPHNEVIISVTGDN